MNIAEIIKKHSLNPENCVNLTECEVLMMDSLFDYADIHSNRQMPTLRLFATVAYERFTPIEIFTYLYKIKGYHEDDEVSVIADLINMIVHESD